MNNKTIEINQKLNDRRTTTNEQWKILNDDGRNGIDKHELRRNLGIMNIDKPNTVTETIMNQYDVNRNGVIDKLEFDKFKTKNEYRPLDSPRVKNPKHDGKQPVVISRKQSRCCLVDKKRHFKSTMWTTENQIYGNWY
jgi:hypothetical protein